MTCFLTPAPLPPPPVFPNSHHVHRPSHNSSPVAALKPLTPPVSSSIPAGAAEIVDQTAISMLNSLSLTPLPTQLCEEPITTSHLTQLHKSDKPALVFLHGFDSNLLEFRRLHSVLSSNPPTTLHYVDVLGWGMTARPGGISYGPVAKREHLRAFLGMFEARRPVILVGASLGAAIAVDFAVEYPEIVAKIVLIDGQVYLDRPKVPIPRFLASVGADVLRSRWLRNIAAEMTYENGEFLCDDVVNIGRLHCVMEGWKESTIDFIMGAGYCVSNKVCLVREKSFVVWGEHDRVLPSGHAKRFEKDGLPVVVAKGCGHSPHIEDPLFVADYLRSIVETVS